MNIRAWEPERRKGDLIFVMVEYIKGIISARLLVVAGSTLSLETKSFTPDSREKKPALRT